MVRLVQIQITSVFPRVSPRSTWTIPVHRSHCRAYSLLLLTQTTPGMDGFGMHDGVDGLVLGAYWGGIVRIALGHNVIWSINSFCHAVGRRPYETADRSRNFSLLSILSFGESWHNNHHETPTSAKFAHHWWQVDIGWAIIRVMRALRMATDVKCHRSAT